MAKRSVVILVSILLLGASIMGALAHAPNDDAGTGTDAPDHPGHAFNVSPAAYVGNLTPGSYEDDLEDYDSYEDENITKDEDWYRVDANQETPLACTNVYFESDDEPHNGTLIHLNEPGLDRAWINASTTSKGANLSMVGPGASGTIFGLASMDPPRVTGYTFDVDVLPLEEAEGADEADQVPGPCFGDSLQTAEEHNWEFDAEEGDFLFLSFGTETDRPDELRLIAPNGTQTGSITSADDIGLGATTLDETGTWTLSAEGGSTELLSLDDSSYTIGLTQIEDFSPDDDDDDDDEPNHRPCDPHCMG